MGGRDAWIGLACTALILVGTARLALAEMPSAAREEESTQVDGALRKLGRGIANVVTCPVELLRTPERVGQRDGYLAAMTVGVLQGAWRTLLRGTVGIFEVATFYLDSPNHFEPLITPEFAFGSPVESD